MTLSISSELGASNRNDVAERLRPANRFTTNV